MTAFLQTRARRNDCDTSKAAAKHATTGKAATERKAITEAVNKANGGLTAMEWPRDNVSEKLHPTQKPVQLLERLISIFTAPGDVVIDTCCGSGSTIIAASRSGRSGYGFDIKKNFFTAATKWLDGETRQPGLFTAPRKKHEQAELIC